MSLGRTLLAEAFDHHQTGGFEEADRLYRRILADEPAQALALHRYALLVAQLGRLEEADGLLRRALALEPDTVEAVANHARILRALRRPDDAARRFRHALTLAPALLTAQEGLGHAQREGGNTVAAAGSYGRAALLGAGAAILHQWGVALESSGNEAAAAEALRRSIRLDPTVPSVAVRLAAILQRMGSDGAAGWYRHALVLQPGRSDVRQALVGTVIIPGDGPPRA
ncbi:tetratricopeptide repeat protein [Azospirillum sp. B506]|uniref:tetratricopeptide repeat protein n=1 Tax=Azospirillum sp. B506 TaxID=137721 RepID=UPI0005B2E57E|nr:tetratricopeptide repeat protein [Azospirillum sp. B506]